MAQRQDIDPHSVKVAADNLDMFANRLTARLKRIKGECDRAFGAYSGDGATAFQNSMAGWDATAVNIRRVVFELANLVRTAGTKHKQSDQFGIDAFNAATGGDYRGLL